MGLLGRVTFPVNRSNCSTIWCQQLVSACFPFVKSPFNSHRLCVLLFVNMGFSTSRDIIVILLYGNALLLMYNATMLAYCARYHL